MSHELYKIRTTIIVKKKIDMKNTNKEHTRFDHEVQLIVPTFLTVESTSDFLLFELKVTNYNLCLNISPIFKITHAYLSIKYVS